MLSLFITLHPFLFYVFLILFSLSIGSFLNVVIYRLPLMLEQEWTSQCQSLLNIEETKSSRLNIVFPRSFCPHCKTNIPAWHNIPILSYLLLRGRCHHCKTHIPLRYPLVELLTLTLSLLAISHFGYTPELAFALLFIWILIPIYFIDLDHQLIPDVLSLSLLWIGLLANTQMIFTSLHHAVIAAVIAYLTLWIFIQLFYLLTGKIGMGNGDFKLYAAFGAWFGWSQLPFILLAASFIGALVGIGYLKCTHQSKETPIPFGPFLCIAGMMSLFWGNHIMQWYLQMYVH